MKSLFALSCLTLLASCAVAPFSAHTTGHTNGAGSSVLSVGTTEGAIRVPFVKYDYGALDNLDIGVDYEFITIGGQIKYGFMDPHAEGIAAALLAGGGTANNGYYIYGAPVISYRTGIFEPFFSPRYNYVHFDADNVDLGGLGVLTISDGHYNYFMYTIGLTVTPLKWLALSAEYTFLGSAGGSGTLISSAGYPSFAAKFNW